MNMIKPARNYVALRKAHRAMRWNRTKQTLLSWLGFAVYILALAIMAAAAYVVAVALM